MADPLPGPGGKKSSKSRRRMLIYGGVAAALLVMFILSRRTAAQQAPADAGLVSDQPLTPVPTAPTDGAGSAGVDNSAQLAGFENDLLDQLPQAIYSGIQAGFSTGAMNPATDASSGTSFSDMLAGVAAIQDSTAGLISGIIGNRTGQQVGGGNTPVSSPAPAAKPAAHAAPAGTHTAQSGPRAGQSYRDVIRGNTFGHLYDNGKFIPIRPATHSVPTSGAHRK